MKHIIKTKDCIECLDPCCRFSPCLSEHFPIFSKAEYEEIIKRGNSKKLFKKVGTNVYQLKLMIKEGNYLKCPLLKEDNRMCAVYDLEPYYCRMWPFGIMKGFKKDKNIYLIIDLVENCPAIKKVSKEEMKNFINYLKSYLQKKELLHYFKSHPELIKNYDTDYTKLVVLKELTKEFNK